MVDSTMISEGLAAYSKKAETEIFDTTKRVEKKLSYESAEGLNQSIDKLYGNYDLSDPFGHHTFGTTVTLAKSARTQVTEVLEKEKSAGEEKKINDRIKILARKYVRGNIKTEEQARLEILSAYVNRHFPRVTLEEIKKVGEVAESLHSISKKVVPILKKYQK